MNKSIFVKLLSLLMVTLPFSTCISARDSTGHSCLYFSLVPQYYFNKKNIKNDNYNPNPIGTKNTGGYYIGLEFERVTRFGLILNAGIRYGIRNHNLLIRQDLSNFDPQANVNLQGIVFEDDISIKLKYLNPCIKIGYNKQLFNDWSISSKVGLFETLYINGVENIEYIDLKYYTDYSSNLRNVRFMSYEADFGETDRKNRRGNIFTSGKLFRTIIYVCELYVGASKTVESKYIKYVSLGIEANRVIYMNLDGGHHIDVKSKPSIDYNYISHDKYVDRNISIGLRFAVGLWK